MPQIGVWHLHGAEIEQLINLSTGEIVLHSAYRCGLENNLRWALHKPLDYVADAETISDGITNAARLDTVTN